MMRMKHWNMLPREVAGVTKMVDVSFQPKLFYDIIVVVIVIIIILHFSPNKRYNWILVEKS